MSWFGNIRKGFRDEIFDKHIKEFYDAVKISRFKASQVEPDYDETREFDEDYIIGGIFPEIEIDNDTKEVLPYERTRKGKIKSKKIRIPITKAVREFVYTRAEYRCEHCDEQGTQAIHHKDGNPANNDYSNLMAVCYDCHKILDAYIRVRSQKQK